MKRNLNNDNGLHRLINEHQLVTAKYPASWGVQLRWQEISPEYPGFIGELPPCVYLRAVTNNPKSFVQHSQSEKKSWKC